MAAHLRIARPVTDLQRTTAMYCRGLGLRVIAEFAIHAGFDGVMLGDPASEYHFEFTHCHAHPVAPTPTAEDLIVFYIPDGNDWEAAGARMNAAGFKRVPAFNPYWDERGRTFEDPDGYRIVLQRATWRNTEAP